jgi:hypothetical protein
MVIVSKKRTPEAVFYLISFVIIKSNCCAFNSPSQLISLKVFAKTQGHLKLFYIIIIYHYFQPNILNLFTFYLHTFVLKLVLSYYTDHT